MTFLSDTLLRFRSGAMAMSDAEVGVYNEDQAIVTLIGPEPPAFDPITNDEDRRLQHQRTGTTLRDEMEEDRRARETARVNEWSLLMALPVVLALFLVEWWASARLLLGIGVEPTTSLMLGGALASGVFLLAWYCAREPKRKGVYLLAILSFAVLIFALTKLRMQEVTSDEGDAATDFASGVVLVVISLGPAFLGEMILRRTASALFARRDLRTAARQLKTEEQRIKAAEKAIAARNAARRTWISQNAIGRAEYRRTWDIERVRVVAKETAAGPPPPSGPTPPARTTPPPAMPAVPTATSSTPTTT